ncbi:MAG: penicillin-binding protein 2 [Betaproteobacteria bacterium]|nr:penicillin-binding protein 2 [Betaproteobacteria bacterium]
MNSISRTGPGLRLPAARAYWVMALLLAAFVVLEGRDIYLQGPRSRFLRNQGSARYSRIIEIPAHRGMILDRNGHPLAISTPVKSVWASPADFRASADQMAQLSRLLGLPAADIESRLADRALDFVYLKRLMPPPDAQQVAALHIPGVFLQREYRRYYPTGDVAAQLIGFTDVDDKGQEGLELAYQDWLAGKPGSRRVIKDRLGHIVQDVENITAPRKGHDLTLSIDRDIQYLAFRALQNAVVASQAESGSLIVLNAKTGEVLALANLPSFNPNNRDKAAPSDTRNRAVTDAAELGSVMKPFTIAAALQAGVITPNTQFQTAPGVMSLDGWTISDAERNGLLTVAQVLQVSSNIGAAKIALRLTPKQQWTMLHAVGFGQIPDTGFPGETAGDMRPYADWRPIDQATIAHGNGISASLLQLARAYTVFADGGVLMPLSFVKVDSPVQGRRVMSRTVANEVRRMLELVVEPGGTAPDARIPGYTVAGKTGTAHKVRRDGGYARNRYIASFVGMAPASDPRLIVAVALNQPSAGHYYGGEVAAPVFAQVMAASLRRLDVPPDAPDAQAAPPAPAKKTKEAA